MRQLLNGLSWAVVALLFGACGAVLIVTASLLGAVLDWTLYLVFWLMIGVCRCIHWLWKR